MKLGNNSCELQPSVSVLVCDRDSSVMQLKVVPGKPFSAAGHLFLLAGIDSNGQITYVGGHHPGPYRRSRPCMVEEGAKSARYLDRYGAKWMIRDFFVLVLRYDPRPADGALEQPASSVAAGHLRWRKLTTKGKLLYERRWWISDDSNHRFRIASWRSGELIDAKDIRSRRRKEADRLKEARKCRRRR